ncbi:class I SAM-dependent methyltransferase [Actinomycetaceae bacterium TAE3-ERU4]|nr:class I SAM-dependent methyltransferase [Actinomycetaceae bacterium TAE3-ERU4]
MSKPIRATWDGTKAEVYLRTFSRVCAGTIPFICEHLEGSTIADIGCGCGDLVATIATCINDHTPELCLTGCDSEPAMVELARERFKHLPTEFRCDALPKLTTYGTDTQDTTISNFVINHVPNPLACMRGLARITKPGGKIITTIWPNDFLPHRDLIIQAINTLTPPKTTPPKNAANPSALADFETNFERSTAGLSALNAAAGLSVSKAETYRWKWETTWETYWSAITGGLGNIGQHYLAQTPQKQAEIKRHIREKITPYLADNADGNILKFPCQAIVCVARKN